VRKHGTKIETEKIDDEEELAISLNLLKN